MNKNTTKALGLATATAVLAGGVAATNTVAHADDVKESAQSTTADQTSTATQTKEQAQAAVDAQQKVVDTDQAAVNANTTDTSSKQAAIDGANSQIKTANDNKQKVADDTKAVADQQKVVDQATTNKDAAQKAVDEAPKTVSVVTPKPTDQQMADGQKAVTDATDAQKQANTDVENANKTIADVKAATDNTQRDADRAAAQQKVDDQQKVVDQAKAAVDAAADPDAAYNKAVSDAQTAHDNTIKTATDAQSQAQRAADAADAAVTNANKDVPRQAQGGDDKGSFYPSDWPSTMFVHNLAELPTTVNDPFTGGDDAATRQTIHAMLYYQDNGTDTSEHVINGQITEAQFNTLQSYFISLVNGYRTAHGLGTISATTEGKAFSDYITNLRNSLNMGYNHTDMFDIHTGAPLDFNKDRAKVTESDHAIETAANQSGFHNSSEVQGLLQQSTANVGYRTMADLMTGVYQVVSSMLYDDGMAIWGHRTALSDPDIKFAALTINPTHDADSNKLYKGYNYDIQLETLTPVNGKSVSDFHTLDNNIAFNLINTTRATYGASADQLKAQTDAHTALDAAKQHVTDVTNSADATLASAKADALQVKNAAGTNIDTLKGTLATAQSTLTNLQSALAAVPADIVPTDEQKKTLADAEAALTDAQNRVTSSAADLQKAQAALQKLTDDYNAGDQAHDVANPDLPGLQASLQKATDALTAENQKLQDLQNRLAADQDAAKTADADIASANETVAKTTPEVTALQAQLVDLQKKLATDTDDLKAKQQLLANIVAADAAKQASDQAQTQTPAQEPATTQTTPSDQSSVNGDGQANQVAAQVGATAAPAVQTTSDVVVPDSLSRIAKSQSALPETGVKATNNGAVAGSIALALAGFFGVTTIYRKKH